MLNTNAETDFAGLQSVVPGDVSVRAPQSAQFPLGGGVEEAS